MLGLSWMVAFAFAAAGLFLRAAFRPFAGVQRGFLWAAGGVVLVVLLASAIGVWVEWHGDRCIGPC